MLLNKLQADLKLALKAKDALRVSVLRMILSAINYEEIEKQHDLNDEEITAVLLRDAKKHRESIESFKKGNREDLWKKEEEELAIIQTYLPKQMSNADLKAEVGTIVASLTSEDKQNFGKVMAVVMSELKGKADGAVIVEMVKEELRGSKDAETSSA
ncbi:GatB/YqeY domain-containing protein [Candidatus Gottesmanbacteria bacterium]|nr:GatB/YqeY domain-containing protein [Candidatus Gottesmanbacteria bacterium]